MVWMGDIHPQIHVIAAAPGFGQINIVLHLGSLEFAQGTVPSPYGPIHVKHTKDKNGKIHTETDVPSGIVINNRHTSQ